MHRGEAPRWTIEPTLSLGLAVAVSDVPSPEEFGSVESVVADAAGQLYVADGMALEIRVFSPSGEHIRTFGRRGEGPGELGGLHGIAWLSADTLVAMDYGNARLTLLDRYGEYQGQWRWLRLTGSSRFLFNGGVREVYAHTFRAGTDGGGVANRATWVRYSPAGPVDSLDIPREEPRPGAQRICRGDGIGFFSNPFADRFIAAPASDGHRVVAWSSEYRLAFLDREGDTVRVVSRDVPRAHLPDSAWSRIDESFRRFEATWAGADCEGSISRPDNGPTLRDIFMDHDGRALVEYVSPKGTAFDVLSSDGLLLRSFKSPADRDRSVAPFLRDDNLYLVTKDSLGVQRVRAFHLTSGR